MCLMLFAVVRIATRKHDLREPPYLSPRIPIIGHALGILRYGVPYYAKISAQTSAPIFTLDLLVNRLYVVTSAKIVAAVQKNHKVIAFDPFLTGAANRMAGIEGPGLKLLQESQSGGGNLNQEVLHAMVPSLLGSGLDKMNITMVSKLEPLITKLVEQEEGVFDLHEWCRHAITAASTEAIWGTKNPFRSDKTCKNFWYFESHLSILLAKIYPSITARKTYLARQTVVDAMQDFMVSGGYDDEHCSDLAQSRYRIQKERGASARDIARLETALNVGVLSNTVPSTFWTLFDIYSRPQLLETVRAEIKKSALFVDPKTQVHAIDLAALRSACPVLGSVFQEVLRVHSNGAPTRMVYEDVMLDGTYFLKAGSVLQLSGPAINAEKLHWGPEAFDFDPSHFEASGGRVAKSQHKPRATSFMSFGASPNLCPGRHFAAAEILSLVAMLIMRVDMVPERGHWWTPRLNPWAIAASMTPPAEAFPVQVCGRTGFEGVKWRFTVTESKNRFNLITG
ncbi:putative P450 monooxygenase [Teratosphaeria nubilosa]|uniref:Putative P450 monooxygenase n=1 Tax=Teratosphaeria nubilosa TaxID=161662 RepID=A0A6G1LC62_9PEZI|nr:putative P450 monooxygenase [Teratosphaeria nubilosa]